MLRVFLARHRFGHAVTGLAFGLGTVLAQGCREAEPLRYRVATRLIDAMPALGGQRRTPAHCVLADDRRPAIGCSPPHLLRQIDGATIDPGEAMIAPPALRGRPMIARASIERTDPAKSSADLPPVLLGPPPLFRPTITLSDLGIASPPADGVVRVWLREVPLQRVRTDAVAVAPGAVLRVALALDPVCRGASVKAVDFTITAARGSQTFEVLRESLDADDAAVSTWHERRVPLDAVVGPAVSFSFVTRIVARPGVSTTPVLGRPGADAVATTAVPLWGEPAILEPIRGEQPPNVLLVSLDTLRADGLGTYGSRLETSPHLDAFAREGVVFERAISPLPATTASHMSMFTGLYPARHGVLGPTSPLGPGTPTLAAVLGAHGWQTGAVTEDGMVAPHVGFPIGFSEYRENHTTAPERVMRGVETTVTLAVEWLERHANERFFLFVHTYEVHAPYRPPPEFDVFRTWQDGDRTRPIQEATGFEQLRHLYAGETRYADAQVSRLLDTLARLALADHTLVVITADHGEEFGEHGGLSHARTLYDEALHVPLMVRAPGRIPAGRRIATLVSLVDLMPTILDLVGVSSPSDLDGESQLPRIRGAPDDPARMVFAELPIPGRDSRRLIAARTATRKWIFDEKQAQVVEAYALDTDPAERHSLTDDDVQPLGLAAVEPYRRLGGAATAASSAAEPTPLDDGLKANLRALGYAE